MHLLKTQAAKVSLSESLNAPLDCQAGRIVQYLHIDARSGLIGRYGPVDLPKCAGVVGNVANR
jgi:hypothetical protein